MIKSRRSTAGAATAAKGISQGITERGFQWMERGGRLAQKTPAGLWALYHKNASGAESGSVSLVDVTNNEADAREFIEGGRK